MSMGRRPRKGGAETDAFCRCSYHSRWHMHNRAAIKRQARRRERRQQRQGRAQYPEVA